MTVDELHGIFSTYEMIRGQNEPLIEEAVFKVSKETKMSEIPSKNHSENSDDEESLFIKKLKRGIHKYKGKIPLKCFNCVIIEHFASKFPYPKQDNNNEREASKKLKKGKTKNKKNFKEKMKILYTMKYSEDENISGGEETKILLMGIETQAQDGESNEEGELDLKV